MQNTLFSWFQLFVGLFGVISIFLVFIALMALLMSRRKKTSKEIRVDIKCLNSQYTQNKNKILQSVLEQDAFKKLMKKEKEDAKLEKKKAKDNKETSKRIFLLDFNGDVSASCLPTFREQITVLLQIATLNDEIVLRLESPGGYVHAYGLAASQLVRIREKGIPLTICVDKVAASGGYMMACLANKIIAAPFSILGSIGVVANIPNFHRVLDKNNVDYLEMTAGDYKRTLTMLGEVTQKGKNKFQEQLEETHDLFKNHIKKYRPHLNIEIVATGEYWMGTKAFELQLIDEISTSDDYLLTVSEQYKLYQIYSPKKETWKDKFLGSASLVFKLIQDKKVEMDNQSRLFLS